MKRRTIKDLSQERLKELLSYDPITGDFTRRKSTAPNAQKGDIAGGFNAVGYIVISVDDQSYLAHRLAWLYVYGYLPEHGLDHRDRIRHHNWIKNLREATQQCNMRNVGKKKNNKSGVTGVCMPSDGKTWLAQIMVDRKQICLGHYKKISDAVKARWEAEKKYNFPNCNTSSSAFLFLEEKGLA